MDSGTVGAYTFMGGAAWFLERSSAMTGGETLVGKPLGGDVWMDGFRCSKCRLLLLHY